MLAFHVLSLILLVLTGGALEHLGIEEVLRWGLEDRIGVFTIKRALSWYTLPFCCHVMSSSTRMAQQKGPCQIQTALRWSSCPHPQEL